MSGIPSLQVPEDYLRLCKRRGVTCCVDVKVGGLIGDVPSSFQARTFRSDFTGVSLGLVDIYFEWALGDVLSCKEDCDLQSDRQVRHHHFFLLSENTASSHIHRQPSCSSSRSYTQR